MPKPTTARLLHGSLPSGSYAASFQPQVQGRAGNKTLQYLAGLDPNDPGQQGFWGEALNDIPHPLETGKTLTYGGLHQALSGPQRGAILDAYARQNRLDRVSAEQVQQREFDAGKARLLQRAAAQPDRYAFPAAADAARRAPATAAAIAHGDYVQAAGPTSAAVQAQRFADLAGTQPPVMAAPGMSVRLVRGDAPAPAPKVIHGTLATR